MNPIRSTQKSKRFIRLITTREAAERASIGKTMTLSRFVALAIFLTLVPVLSSQAQMDQSPGGGNRAQELVDRLKELIRGAERDQRSSPWLIQQLRDLVRRYDWPWRVSLLYDDFRDGDYTSNPRWVVSSGDFWVTRESGLRSVFDPPPPQSRRASDRRGDSPAMGILEEFLWGAKERERGETQITSKSGAEIHTKLGISNAFAAKLQLRLRGYADRNTRIEFGPYLGDELSSGYRLAYESGKNPLLSLLRVAPGRSAVIETSDRGIDLEDGNPHTVEWRRSNDGQMVVLLDDNEIIRTVDRAYGDSFDGFGIINKGGDFELKQISIFGTQR